MLAQKTDWEKMLSVILEGGQAGQLMAAFKTSPKPPGGAATYLVRYRAGVDPRGRVRHVATQRLAPHNSQSWHEQNDPCVDMCVHT